MWTLLPVGFAGDDGEGYELRRALAAVRGVRLDHFLQTNERCTFTYCKPLVLVPGQAPRELSRLDQKNWTPTPVPLVVRLCVAVTQAAEGADAFALLGQVDLPATGVLTTPVLEVIRALSQAHPVWLTLADSRHGLQSFPPLAFKLNFAEAVALFGLGPTAGT